MLWLSGLITVAGAGLGWIYDTVFLPWNDAREDHVRLNDCFLNSLPELDTNPIVSLVSCINICCLILEAVQYWDIHKYTVFVLTMILLHTARALCMFLCPLASPSSIRFRDCCVDFLRLGRASHVNDCFFSGHTGLVCVLVLCSETPLYFGIFSINAVVTITALLLGRFHYTVDIIVAISFSVHAHSMAVRVLGYLINE